MSNSDLPTGFRYSGVSCGIKASGKPDVSLIVADNEVIAAGVYTKNQIVAAPVTLSKSRTESNRIRAVIANSGNANACTGDQGFEDAQAMCKQVAEKVGCDEDQVLVMSTGIIGQHLPMDCVNQGIEAAFSSLADTETAFLDAAEAILTTDKSRKTQVRELQCGDKTYRIAAMAKGAGMIAPNMATMLAVVLTDAPLDKDSAQRVLSEATELSFNQVSVDGHTSTNDTVLLLSSGTGNPLVGDQLSEFQRQLNQISIDLAVQLVADGEGATHVMEIQVTGANSDCEAKVIARTVGASPLVKTAITGGDPNWGRIVSAAGYAEAIVTPEKTSLSILGTKIYQSGLPVSFDAKRLSQKMKDASVVRIELCVGDGDGESRFWASDLTTDYVTFNSEYTT